MVESPVSMQIQSKRATLELDDEGVRIQNKGLFDGFDRRIPWMRVIKAELHRRADGFRIVVWFPMENDNNELCSSYIDIPGDQQESGTAIVQEIKVRAEPAKALWEENKTKKAEARKLVEEKNRPKPGSDLLNWGVLLMFIGVGVAIWFQFGFDPSVETGTTAFDTSNRVVNLQRISQQMMGYLGGFGLFIVGGLFCATGQAVRLLSDIIKSRSADISERKK